jgi:DNA-binding transcriptional ArsR family regulator
MVERLVLGPASVSELRAPFSVSLSAIGQHLQLLEACELVRSRKLGRVRTVELQPGALAAAERWFASHRERWERRFDRLATVLAEPDDERPSPNPSTKRPKSPKSRQR